MSPPDKDGVTNVRMRKKTLHIFQMASAWKNLTLVEYFDHLAETQGMKDLREAQKGIQEMDKGGKNG
ncbi:MAG: hypothetical protein ACO3F3_18565 [Gemmataceae bacterium]